MDANGTRHFLFLGEADWGRCREGEDGKTLAELWAADADTAVVYDVERDDLILKRMPFVFPPTGPVALGPSDRRGAARDRYGTWYWIDATRRGLLVNSAGSGTTTVFWPPDGAAETCGLPEADFGPVRAVTTAAPRELSGTAVTEDGYLVVGCAEPPGLLVFDLRSGGPPDLLPWPDTVPFTPFDLASRVGGGVYVLDRDHRRYWELDRAFQVVPNRTGSPEPTSGGFEAVGPGPGPDPGQPCPPPRPITADDAIALEAGTDPVALDAAADGTVLLLFRAPAAGPSTVRAYRHGVPTGPALATEGPGGTPVVAGHDLALLPTPAGTAYRLFLADAGGDQAFEFTLDMTGVPLRLKPVENYCPMRLFGGKGLVAAGGEVHYDFADRWLPLTTLPRHRYADTGTVITGRLDSGEPGCVWHRLFLDACLPPETGLRVFSSAADHPDDLDHAPDWVAEPALYPRGDGSEQPYARTGGYRTWELAFQRATGRHLRLRLELVGNGRATPHVRALRAYCPRFSYLTQYLPTAYRADSTSASFLDRFLANFEGIFTGIEDRIAAVQTLFDPRSTPPEALEWLGQWFDLAMDPAWDEAKRRLMVTHAMKFFQWRGTVRGLQTALALVIEEGADDSLFSDAPSRCALRTRIVERHQTRRGADGRRPLSGADALHRQYADALDAAGITVPDGIRFPLLPPGPDHPATAVWRAVAEEALGSLPVVDQVQAWRDFLSRRYPRPADLNSAYGLTGSAAIVSYDRMLPPTELPEREPAFTDWLQFQTVVLPRARTAHRFRVLLPVPLGAGPGDAEPRAAAAARAARVDLVRRVVELEKPAHTVFDVKFYWEAFRVGEARLGLDSLVDLGSRSPNLLTEAVLGRSYLGESLLTDPLTHRRCP
ncbi:phage tail protein [Streptomyces virginiae]|uniref:phage tail protein n=1 Tax=Streptomyces virginiae TaxID=1961 RepID=UPI003692B9DE